MSRTRRNKRPRMNLGDEAKRYQYRDGKVRDGTPQYASGSCQNHGGCPVCEGNRLHKHKKQMSTSMAFYRKKQLQELIPWTDDLSMDLVSISEADKANGSPKEGDMLAFNPNNITDMWLVAEEFFKDNYELVVEEDYEEFDEDED